MIRSRIFIHFFRFTFYVFAYLFLFLVKNTRFLRPSLSLSLLYFDYDSSSFYSKSIKSKATAY